MKNPERAILSVLCGVAAALAFLLLVGCGQSGTIVRTPPPVTISVPVHTPCVTTRPAEVVPLKQQFTDDQWAALDVKQKSALVGKQGLDRMTYGEQLDAATAGCK